MLRSDIQIVPENKAEDGEDYFIGDVHGCLTEFNKVIERLKEHDRLFIAGDLADRGPESLAVLKTIIQHNLNRKSPKIFAVRGNHEETLLQYCIQYLKLESIVEKESKDIFANYQTEIEVLSTVIDLQKLEIDDIQKKVSEYTQKFNFLEEKVATIRLDYKLEGQGKSLNVWLKEKGELIEKQLNDLLADHVETERLMQEAMDECNAEQQELHKAEQRYETLIETFDNFIHHRDILLNFDSPQYFGRKELWVDTVSSDDIKLMKEYLESLPYIISSPEFNVVHADIPMTDQELKRKIAKSDLSLSPAEIEYAIWARSKDSPIAIKYKNESMITSKLTICGHSIGEGVRPANNAINLDIGTFYTKCVALLHFKKNHIELIGSPEAIIENTRTAKNVIERIEDYLTARKMNLSWQAPTATQYPHLFASHSSTSSNSITTQSSNPKIQPKS